MIEVEEMARKDRSKLILAIYTFLVLAFFLLPLAMVAVLSFKAGSGISFPIEGFTLDWYFAPPGKLGTGGFRTGIFHDLYIIDAVKNSLILGITVGLIVMAIGLPAALAFRHRFIGRDILFYVILAGFILPGVIMGLGMNLFYKAIGVKEFSLWTVIPLHVVYTLPFSFILTLARFDPMLMEYENAAKVLGASGWQVFRKITFPLIKTEALAFLIFSFTLSLGELLRTSYVISGSGTIPTYIYNQMSVVAPTPKWYALGTITTAISFIVLLVGAMILTRGARKVF